jgi:pSer/pThr/pTyr-binding forkhead associated (FHA) protein
MTSQTPVLKPVTRQARKAVEHSAQVALDDFPYKIGRESRLNYRQIRTTGPERRSGDALPNNDLYLENRGRLQYVSREHFQIERKEDGTYMLVDRGSTLGTTVAGRHIGGSHEGGSTPLHDGDRISIGLTDSPIAFEFKTRASTQDGSSRRKQLVVQWMRLLLLLIAPVVVSALTIVSVLKW